MHSAGEETYQETRQVEQGNFATAGQISASFKNTLKKLGVASPVSRRIAIASYEAEINLAIHSWGGTMRLVIYPNRVRLLVDDVGPGIADIDLAMQEGYSTASEEVRMLGFGAGTVSYTHLSRPRTSWAASCNTRTIWISGWI